MRIAEKWQFQQPIRRTKRPVRMPDHGRPLSREFPYRVPPPLPRSCRRQECFEIERMSVHGDLPVRRTGPLFLWPIPV